MKICVVYQEEILPLWIHNNIVRVKVVALQHAEGEEAKHGKAELSGGTLSANSEVVVVGLTPSATVMHLRICKVPLISATTETPLHDTSYALIHPSTAGSAQALSLSFKEVGIGLDGDEVIIEGGAVVWLIPDAR